MMRKIGVVYVELWKTWYTMMDTGEKYYSSPNLSDIPLYFQIIYLCVARVQTIIEGPTMWCAK